MRARTLLLSWLPLLPLIACRESPRADVHRAAPPRELATLDPRAGPVLDSLEGPWVVGVPGVVRVTSRGSSSCVAAAGADVQYAAPPADTAPAIVRLTVYDVRDAGAELCTDDWGEHARLVAVTPRRTGVLEFQVYGRPEVRAGHVAPDTLPAALGRVFVLPR